MENVQQKGVVKGFVLLVGFVLVLGSFVHEGLCQAAMDLNQKVKTGQYIQKVDNFMVILDASDTMNTPYEGRSRWQMARDVVLLLNRTIPDISVMGAVRKYSDVGNYNDLTPTALVYGPTKYSLAMWMALLPLMKPTTCETIATEYLGGMEISICA